ncbi:hypothetical protein ACFV9C_18205 [Kribbella sp. NPDC059898]|uniref:hypothetical protein n=1 Tax=Kribbella sp. NPDC059898 TaxID=3346995 RepID=UPI003665FEAF
MFGKPLQIREYLVQSGHQVLIAYKQAGRGRAERGRLLVSSSPLFSASVPPFHRERPPATSRTGVSAVPWKIGVRRMSVVQQLGMVAAYKARWGVYPPGQWKSGR